MFADIFLAWRFIKLQTRRSTKIIRNILKQMLSSTQQCKKWSDKRAPIYDSHAYLADYSYAAGPVRN